jgi:Spy/CpxP family protein refolding chaperone
MNAPYDTPNTSPPPAVSPPPRRRKRRSILLGIAILLGGMCIGSGLTLRVLWTQVTSLVQHPEQLPERAAQRMTRTLDLTPEQETRLKAVLTERQQGIETLRREIHPRMQAEMEKLRAEVAAILTPDQAARWNQRFEQLRARWWPPLLPAPQGEPAG